MSPLPTYYLFLAATAIVIVALRRSQLVRQQIDFHMSDLIVPPLILIVSALNLSFVMTLVLALLVVVVGRTFRLYVPSNVTQSTFGVWICLWIIEATLPLAAHLVFRSQPHLEKWLVPVVGIVLVAVVILVFLLRAPHLAKEA